MAASKLIDFGSHTAGHHILTTLTTEEVWHELKKSREMLYEKGCACEQGLLFCYPNGNYNDAICKLVEKAGYISAVTPVRGWHRMGSDRFRMKRIPVHQDMTASVAMLGCRITGLI